MPRSAGGRSRTPPSAGRSPGPGRSRRRPGSRPAPTSPQRELVRVHAAVADRVDRPTLHMPTRRPACATRSPTGCCVSRKPCPSPRSFGTTNRLRPRWPLVRSGSVRASSANASARAANVHHVLTPLITQPGSPSGPAPGTAGDRDAGDVAAEVGLGDGDGRHHLGARQQRQPVQLLLLGAALDECAGEDLGARDQRAADAEAGPAQLLGGDHHRQVLVVAALAEAAVLGGHAEPERAELGEAADDLLGDVAVGAVDVLGVRGDRRRRRRRGTSPAPSPSRRRDGAGPARGRQRGDETRDRGGR